ncbi:MAG TPA: ATP-binding protein, partial [Thermoanaerobaculia bacterium]|nr:ATP-binding protein [Thermoanaerobaculia bacterium]
DAALPDVASGAGIPGHAAADRRTLVVRDIPSDTPFRIGLGFAVPPPRFLVASPMIVEDRVVGVVLLGALRELEAEGVRFVEEAACQLAITLDNALAHTQVAHLVAQLRQTNERLAEQNEELQAQSEELQTQSEELQAQNEELQAQSDELRAQQDSLASTNRALAEAEEQKNRFLAVLGHELRNPLAAIRGAVALTDDGGLSTERTNAVIEVMKRQTAHLSRLVDDLLDVGRITSGKVELTRRPLDLTAVVARCVASAAREEGAPISLKGDAAVWIDADETRIEQIVTNLLTNALKYTPREGSISVDVSQDASGALLRVADTGIGMRADLLPRIFDFFVQGEGRPEASKGGLGVGLTLVKNLVELHGGSVHAMSPGPELCNTMTVRLPALAAKPTLGTGPQPEPEPASARRIVIVEDNEDVRLMMLLMLRRSGHSVTEAADGPAGVAAIARTRPDLAFIDLDLPGFDGCEVARRVRQDSRLVRVHMIALSGYGRPEDRERALAAGFDEHLVKPVDFERLTATIRATRPLAGSASDPTEGSPRLDILAPSAD